MRLLARRTIVTSLLALQPGVLVDGDELALVNQRIVQFAAHAGCLGAGNTPDARRVFGDQLLRLGEKLGALGVVERAPGLRYLFIDRRVTKAVHVLVGRSETVAVPASGKQAGGGRAVEAVQPHLHWRLARWQANQFEVARPLDDLDVCGYSDG